VAQAMPWEYTGKAFSSNVSRATRSDAYMLLGYLRACHGAKNGKPFAISAKPMADANLIDGWKRPHYEKARKALVEAGLLIQVRKRYINIAAQFRLSLMRIPPISPSSRKKE
jgi:hypothetical protein